MISTEKAIEENKVGEKNKPGTKKKWLYQEAESETN